MFTVEMEDEETIITTIDESCRFGDVKLIMDEESVGIIQEECVDDIDYSVFIEMSHQQYGDLIESMNRTVGAYYIKTLKRTKTK